jgi:hypothetical protein
MQDTSETYLTMHLPLEHVAAANMQIARLEVVVVSHDQVSYGIELMCLLCFVKYGCTIYELQLTRVSAVLGNIT